MDSQCTVLATSHASTTCLHHCAVADGLYFNASLQHHGQPVLSSGLAACFGTCLDHCHALIKVLPLLVSAAPPNFNIMDNQCSAQATSGASAHIFISVLRLMVSA